MQELKLTWEERVESLKAGLFGGLAVSLTFPITLLLNDFLANRIPLFAGLQVDGWNIALNGAVPSELRSALIAKLASFAIALLAGFLFGVTYRYIIRQDQNSHLKSGAVMAFGLVRGLAQIDVGITMQGSVFPFGMLALESIFLFAIAQVTLDQAIAQGWLRRFK